MNGARSHWGFAALLGGLAGLGPFAIDTYLPAFPEIARGLGVDRQLVQQSLTAYLVPYAATMLLHGPLSDHFGRKHVVLAALAVFCAGSVGCALSATGTALIFWRSVQGLAAGGSIVVGRALVRDYYSGAEAQRQLARVNMVFAIAPAVAPFVGGQLLALAGWRAIFWFLLAYPAALLAVCLKLLPADRPAGRPPFSPALIGRNLAGVLAAPGCLALALTLAATFAGFFLYVLAAPAFVREHLGLAPTQFHWLFVPTVTGTVIGSSLAARLSHRLGPASLVRLGLAVSAAAAAGNLAWHAAFPPGLPWSVLPVMLYTCGNGLVMPGATLLLLDRSPVPRGATSSVQGFVQMAASGLSSALIVPWVSASALGLAAGMAGWLGLATLAWRVARVRGEGGS